MLVSIINRLLLMVLIMACLNVIRHLYYFIQAWVRSDSDNPVRYVLNNKSLYMLSVSLAYVIACILTLKIYI